jgi:hypothetical protein
MPGTNCYRVFYCNIIPIFQWWNPFSLFIGCFLPTGFVQLLRQALSNGPNCVGLSCPIHLRTVTDPVSETLWSSDFHIEDDG